MKTLPDHATIGELYAPAMEITDAVEASEYLEALVARRTRLGTPPADAVRLEKQNLGYFAGYYDHPIRERVELLFDCEHPVFGKAANGVPSAEQALNAGLLMGLGLKKGGTGAE
jgi:hypothetical protein